MKQTYKATKYGYYQFKLSCKTKCGRSVGEVTDVTIKQDRCKTEREYGLCYDIAVIPGKILSTCCTTL